MWKRLITITDGYNACSIKEYLVFIAVLKPASIKRKMAAAKALFNYLEFEDKVLINPFRKMRLNIKEPKKLPKVMDIKEVMNIFSTAYRHKKQTGISYYGLDQSE